MAIDYGNNDPSYYFVKSGVNIYIDYKGTPYVGDKLMERIYQT